MFKIAQTTTVWVGRAVSAVPVFVLLTSAAMNLTHDPEFSEKLTHVGFPATDATLIGLLALIPTVLYLVPRTSIVGAILLSGFLGAAISAHVRIGDCAGGIMPLVLGVLVWGGLFLRDERIRAFVPLRQDA